MILPFLGVAAFGVAPILFLFNHNRGFLGLPEALALSGAACLLSWFAWLLASRLLPNPRGRALTLSLIWLWFHSFGPIGSLFIGNTYLTRLHPVKVTESIFLAFHTIIFAAAVIASITIANKCKSLRDGASMFATAMGIALLCMQIAGVILSGSAGCSSPSSQVAQDNKGAPQGPSGGEARVAKQFEHEERLPDIFFIIPDAYGRADQLAEMGFDNAEFIRQLRDRGFTVPENSLTNYSTTVPSIASMMRMDFVNDLADETSAKQTVKMVEAIKAANMFSAFKRHGYEIVAISSGWWFTKEFNGTDRMLKAGDARGLLTVTLENSALVMLHRKFRGRREANQIFSAFKLLRQLAVEKGKPKLVFCHMICPHPPYLIDEEGAVREGSDLSHLAGGVPGYAGFARFFNRKIIEVVDAADSAQTKRPIFIIQADHGGKLKYARWRTDHQREIAANDPSFVEDQVHIFPSSGYLEALACFAAYRTPDDMPMRLPSPPTPMNAIRSIRNALGENLSMRPPITHVIRAHTRKEDWPNGLIREAVVFQGLPDGQIQITPLPAGAAPLGMPLENAPDSSY